MRASEPHECGGLAQPSGYLLALTLLYQNPGAGADGSDRDARGDALLPRPPTRGGIWDCTRTRTGAYNAGSTFGLGTYLGFRGLAFAYGSLVAATTNWLVASVGVVLGVLAVVAVVASVKRSCSVVDGLPYGIPGIED